MTVRLILFDLDGTLVDSIPDLTCAVNLLRNELGLRSMKDGCAPEGSCGACTVIVDGRPVVSCAQPAERFAGKEIETLGQLLTLSQGSMLASVRQAVFGVTTNSLGRDRPAFREHDPEGLTLGSISNENTFAADIGDMRGRGK